MHFNSRARGGRDQSIFAGAYRTIRHFNSRARGGRDGIRAGSDLGRRISTHAPAGGATPLQIVVPPRTGISTHAPAGGATMRTAMGWANVKFQLTRPRGARLTKLSEQNKANYISTHAPAGGATIQPRNSVTRMSFQLTRPRGARP